MLFRALPKSGFSARLSGGFARAEISSNEHFSVYPARLSSPDGLNAAYIYSSSK